jgi:hypothetical protein
MAVKARALERGHSIVRGPWDVLVVDVPMSEIVHTDMDPDVLILSDVVGLGLCLPLNPEIYPLNRDVLILPKCCESAKRELYIDRGIAFGVDLLGWEVQRLASCPANYPLMLEHGGVVLGDGGVAAWERASLGIQQVILPSGPTQWLVGKVLKTHAGVAVIPDIQGLQAALETTWEQRAWIRDACLEMGIGSDEDGIINILESMNVHNSRAC